jgi:putative transposase
MDTPTLEILPSDSDASAGTRDWPHAPPHRLAHAGVYFVTARTVKQLHLLDTPERRDWFQAKLLELINQYGWKLEAWAVLSNHYHIIAHSPEGNAASLALMLRHLHSVTTKFINREDATPGRTRLWHNYRETHLNLQRGYLARLHYVHQNAVHHGLVRVGSDWKWCSARAFRLAVTPAWLKTISSFKYDQIAIQDGD